MPSNESTHYPLAPVIETVIGVQFNSLVDFRNAHFGSFWKTVLTDDWKQTQDAPPIADQFETFRSTTAPNLHKVVLRTAGPSDRVQFIHKSDDRVIQLQQTRLLLNWRKRHEDYPRFGERLADFQTLWNSWARFCSESGIGELAPNQWEISYYNHVPRGTLWESPSDWSSILPGLLKTTTESEHLRFEYQDGEWHFELPPERGRLHISLQRASVDGEHLLRWTQTARGPLESDSWSEVESGLRTGHSAIISAFESLSSKKALDHWKGTDNDSCD